MLSIFARFMRGQDASGMLSYGLLTGLISTVVLVALAGTGKGVTLVMDKVESGMVTNLSAADLADFPSVQNTISNPTAIIEGSSVTATIPASMFSGGDLIISSDAATTAPFLGLSGDFVSGGVYTGIVPTAGSYLVTITATNAAGSASTSFTITANPLQVIVANETSPIVNGQYQARCTEWSAGGRCDNPQLKLFDSFQTACPSLPNHSMGPTPVWYTARAFGSTIARNATCADFCRIATGNENFSFCSQVDVFNHAHGSWRAASTARGCVDGAPTGIDEIEMNKGFSYVGETYQNILFSSRDPINNEDEHRLLGVTCDGW